MEVLTQQVTELQSQISHLTQVVEVLCERLAVDVSSPPAATSTNSDILLDEEMSGSRSVRSAMGQNMQPEAQIQRLTAQLTAAYNRIAALEEQLLSRRLHPHTDV